MLLAPLDRDSLQAAWPTIAPFAQQMAEAFPDDWPVGEILRQATGGALLLWLVWSPRERAAYGLVGTEIHQKPSGRRALVVALAAGRAHERWVHCIATLERHAAAHRCDFVEIRGRAGWARHLKSYRAKHGVILEKDLH